MAEPLQNKALLRKLHIALFLFAVFIAKTSHAQSLLLPGDVVFISVSSTSDTFEFIPLINLEKGTEFSISNGLWNSNEQKFSDDQTIKFQVLEPILAGTPIKIGEENIVGLEKRGALRLSEESEQLFLYQKDNENYRFVSAVGWGDRNGRRDRSFLGSEIPEVLQETPNSILRLGSNNNYQYYLRNGASGTPQMLLAFVSNPGFWRGNDEVGFPAFGTSFNILKPPVILFDESFSSVRENSKTTSLQVAIYEHDGSKLTVDVVFDSAYSSIDRLELEGFRSKELNFTGLIGNAVFEIEVPIINDKEFEGNETGIFSLQNLSNGRFGDFISHSLIITDDEIPELKLEILDGFGENILVVHNLESKHIDLRNWEIVKGDTKIILPRDSGLKVGQSIVVISEENYEPNLLSENNLILDKEESKILHSPGLIQLKNQEGKKVSEVLIPKKEVQSSNSISENISSSVNSATSNSDNISSSSSITDIAIPGWKSFKAADINTAEYSSVEFYYWNEPQAKFMKIDGQNLDIPKDAVLSGYFDESDSKKIRTNFDNAKALEENRNLSISLSATDLDENGRIQAREGINLLKNTSNTAISVGGLISFLENEFSVKNSVSVFTSSQRFDRISTLDYDEYILAGQTFWLQLNTEIKQQNITIDLTELNNYEPEIEQEIDKGVLEFEINGNSKSTGFTFSFLPEDVVIENKLNPKMMEEIYLSEFKEIAVSGLVSENHYSSFQINKNLNNVIQVPFQFAASQSGEYEISVKNWTDIPDGWVITIEDLKEEKLYEITDSWSLKFNYSNISEINNGKFNFPTIEDRFVLRVTPKSLVSDVDDELPTTVELHQNYPNPFNPATTISFFMPEEAEVKLSVFNIVGQPVAVLLQEKRGQGEHTLEWDASDMPSGIYIYQLEVGTKIMTRKMTLVK